tara:strand:+ start:2191 stop:2406 length:216 start_codon:yes stop_codon:yes gene_type:complete
MTEDSFAGDSWIQGAKYNSETQLMQIYMSGGSEIYECEGVDSNTWSEFKRADSKGRYFNKYIRGKFNSSSI